MDIADQERRPVIAPAEIDTASPAPVTITEAGPAGWWRIMDTSVGIVPLPVFLVILGLIAGYVWLGKVPADLTTNIAVLTVGGFACAELGKHLPGFKRIGAAAILATFVPSYLVYAHIIPEALRMSISDFTDQSNFLYLFIGSIIVGSILGMDRRMLIGGFLKILVPIMAGTLVALVVGTLVGTSLGIPLKTVIFMIIVPVMAGGVGEGAIPLSIGYATLAGLNEGDLLAEILPAVMLGSLVAIILAGLLNMLGKRRPDLTGNGALQPGEVDEPLTDEVSEPALKVAEPPFTCRVS